MAVGSIQSTIILPAPACTDGLNSKANQSLQEPQSAAQQRQDAVQQSQPFAEQPIRPDNPDQNVRSLPAVNSDNPLQLQKRNPSSIQQQADQQNSQQQAIQRYLDTQNSLPDEESQLVGVDFYV